MKDFLTAQYLAFALRAIIARRDGVFDSEELVSFGPLTDSPEDDMHRIATEALAKVSA